MRKDRMGIRLLFRTNRNSHARFRWRWRVIKHSVLKTFIVSFTFHLDLHLGNKILQRMFNFMLVRPVLVYNGLDLPEPEQITLKALLGVGKTPCIARFFLRQHRSCIIAFHNIKIQHLYATIQFDHLHVPLCITSPVESTPFFIPSTSLCSVSSGSPHPTHITLSQSPPSLSSPITASTFHSRLKTHLFHKSFPP